MAILHGGQLTRVAKQYQIPEDKWLDLSTGISPFSYPINDIPDGIWQDLPTVSEALISAAKRYYHGGDCWPVAGSQSLIEKLPLLWQDNNHTGCSLSEKHVYLPKVGYKEHQHAWLKAGYQPHFYQNDLPCKLEKNCVVVVINPNNPLASMFTIDQLIALQKRCKKQQALLIVDEAFADILPTEFSFVPYIKQACEDVIVLRSVGKFFGLAGLRIGFACTSQRWCDIIQENTGPWSINGAALYITERALNDKAWHETQIKRLTEQSQKQRTLLEKALPVCRIESNALFITVFLHNAPTIYRELCEQAVYVRLTDENNALRFAVANEMQLQRLTVVLQNLSSNLKGVFANNVIKNNI